MRIIATGIVSALWLLASANADEMADVHAAGHWSGCVFQEGFDPYPIRISPRPAPTLKVEYPGLCSGYHTPRQKGWSSEAVEVITKDIGICIETVDLDYSFVGDLLRIDYKMDGNPYALLKSIDPGSQTLTCERSEVIS